MPMLSFDSKRALRLFTAALYAAMLLIANASYGQEKNRIYVYDTPKASIGITLNDLFGGTYDFATNAGKLRVVNFWALWCAGCREEMPTLEALSKRWQGTDFEVITVATGRNDPEQIREWFAREGFEQLPVLLDPRQKLSGMVGVEAIPHTVVLDGAGRVLAYLSGVNDFTKPELIHALESLYVKNTN